MTTVLVTGGAGFIATHTDIELLNKGYDVISVDNYGNSSPVALERVEQITGKPVKRYDGDVRDEALMERVFTENNIDWVIHFAGLKAVGESVADPLRYYDVNVCGAVTLCQAMQAAGVFSLVFSSSATVYGDPARVPIDEDQPVGQPANPYGRSKLMVEQILADLAAANGAWRVALLRYFNPVGAHESGLIGEDPQGVPNNLLPYVAQVASGQREFLNVWGNDYSTPDGTGQRDYIHVCDLAEGHVAALRYLRQHPGLLTVNLGTGRPVSVLEMVRGFEAASGRPVRYQIGPRRAGDVAACWADPGLAERLLGWRARRDVQAMCQDAWRWQDGVARQLQGA